MKKIFLFIVIALAVSSCNSTKLATEKIRTSIDKFLEKYNYKHSETFNPTTNSTIYSVSLENFYETDKVKAICEKANVTLKIADAKIEISANCPGAEQEIRDVLAQLFKAIAFKN